MSNSSPRRLGGRYEIRGLIGHGGMAEVHLAFDTRLNRMVAVKRLRTDLARDTVFQQRFRREAQSAASLNHPNIVAVYDTGEESTLLPDGSNVSVPYIVMEYVEGHTVKELLSDGTAVPIDEAVEIASGILSALSYAHNARLVHRDIKPGNVMLTNDGKVKVMDFGIARALTDSQATMTQTNAVVGTAQYLSPEQARGEAVDARSDLYSVGVLLFELLTGQPPFRGDSAVAVAYQHVSALPPAPSSLASDIPTSLDRVILKAMAKDRDQRYENAAQMRSDLSRALHGIEVTAPATEVWAQMQQTSVTTPLPVAQAAPTRPTYHPIPPTMTSTAMTPVTTQAEDDKKRPLVLLISLALLALIAMGTGLYLLLGRDAPQSSDVEQVEVPASLVGLSQEEARELITEADLVFALGESVPSDEVPLGKVVSTDPPSGTKVDRQSTVTVVLSAGPSSVTIPQDLQGKTLDEARRILEGMGLKIKEDDQKQPSNDVPADRIVKVHPSPGQKVKAGTTITLTLSSGADNVTVPSVEGMTQDQARRALDSAGLVVGNVETVNEPADQNKVVRSHPATNESVPRNTQVTLYVASGNIVIPDSLVGATQDAVVNVLTGIGLSVELVTKNHDSVPAGSVISVEPGSGQLVPFKGGPPVRVTVSEGPAQQPTPPPAQPNTSGSQPAG